MFVSLYWPADKLQCAPPLRQLRWAHGCNLERQMSGDRHCLATELEPTVAAARRACLPLLCGACGETERRASDSLGADSVGLGARGRCVTPGGLQPGGAEVTGSVWAHSVCASSRVDFTTGSCPWLTPPPPCLTPTPSLRLLPM